MVGLFASDLDGTLLGATHRVSRPVLRAIRAATDSGRHFAVATGRVMRSSGGFGFGGVPIEAVCANGAIVLGRDGSVHLVAVYGDGGNDVDMLRRFSRSYAPAGAMPRTGESASRILGSNVLYAVPRHVMATVRDEGTFARG